MGSKKDGEAQIIDGKQKDEGGVDDDEGKEPERDKEERRPAPRCLVTFGESDAGGAVDMHRSVQER